MQELQLPMMVEANQSPLQTAFTVSIEAREGVTTGISAADRATTIRVAADPARGADDLVRPGHVFPLRARAGGVLVRAGHTEGAVDLMRLAGLTPAGVICEILNTDGTMARMDELGRLASERGFPVSAIADLIAYRLAKETLVHVLTQREVRHPEWGAVTFSVFGTVLDDRQHLAVTNGALDSDGAALVRVEGRPQIWCRGG